jgi:hypothetical protein
MMDDDASGRSLTLFITGEDPRSLRTVELDNWSGMAVMGRPEYFKRALERDELERSCVYLLVETAGSDDIPLVYVGETDDFKQRYATAKFPITFDNFLVFTNKDDKLTRAHVKWLELRIWELLAANEGNVSVANKQKPTGSKLPEADRASMRTFLRNMTYMLEALGFEFFGAVEKNSAANAKAKSAASSEALTAIEFVTNTIPKNNKVKAYLVALGDGYLLKAGSAVNRSPTESLPANVRKLRTQLIKEGALVDEGDFLVLKKDISFAKPSPASALVKGRSSSGHDDWYRSSDNLRLGEVLAST